jgi:hypothetical protein
VLVYPAVFPAAEADRLLQELRDTTAWKPDTVKFFDKTTEVPRLTAWYGDEGTRKTDPGIENEPPRGPRPCWRSSGSWSRRRGSPSTASC